MLQVQDAEKLCNPVPFDVIMCYSPGLLPSFFLHFRNINFFPQVIQPWWKPPVV